jgi:hypothetical protein
MDHVVYLDHKAKELDLLEKGVKTMIIRGAMGRKIPYRKVEKGDWLYFIENMGDGLIKAVAEVSDVFNSEQMTREESVKLVDENQKLLRLDKKLYSRFAGKRYIVLIRVKNFKIIDSFRIDRSKYGNMDDWLPVGEIQSVKI